MQADVERNEHQQFFKVFKNFWNITFCIHICNQHENCIKMSTNMPMFGAVVLEIAYYIFINMIFPLSPASGRVMVMSSIRMHEFELKCYVSHFYYNLFPHLSLWRLLDHWCNAIKVAWKSTYGLVSVIFRNILNKLFKGARSKKQWTNKSTYYLIRLFMQFLTYL